MEHPGSLANALRALREYGFPTATARHMCERATYSSSYERRTATYVVTVTFDREHGYRVTDNSGSRACCATPDNAVHVCHLCGKRDDEPHTNDTRKVHMDHLARFGWSGICASPQAR